MSSPYVYGLELGLSVPCWIFAIELRISTNSVVNPASSGATDYAFEG
jgi:hypothetical protein